MDNIPEIPNKTESTTRPTGLFLATSLQSCKEGTFPQHPTGTHSFLDPLPNKVNLFIQY